MSISISNPKRLSTFEFESIHGSELHTTMMRNRLVIGPIDYDKAHTVTSTMKMFTDWLLENCENLYYIVAVKVQYNHTIYVYFSEDTEAVHFKMRFDGNEYAEPEPIPAPVRRPAPKVYQYNVDEEEEEDDEYDGDEDGDDEDNIILTKKIVKREITKANIMKKLLEAKKRNI